MDREELFKQLIDPVKNLLILLHGSKEDFFYDTLTLLDNLILTYDKFVGNDEVVTQLAKGIHLDIPLEIDADMYLLTTIETFLLSTRRTNKEDLIADCRLSLENINPKTIKELTTLMNTTASNKILGSYY